MSGNVEIVYFNVETTGMKYHDEIIHLSAYNHLLPENHDYMMPTVPIDPQAALINGFQVKNGQLYGKGKLVKTIERKTAVDNFFLYCVSASILGEGGQVILVAHKGKCLAFEKLLKEIDDAGRMKDFEKWCKGFCDTMPVLELMFPHRVELNKSFRLVDLHEDIYKGKGHNCKLKEMTKLLIMKEIMDDHRVSSEHFEKHMIGWSDAKMQFYDNRRKTECRESLRKAFGDDNKELRKMIYKIADNQLNLDNLVESYEKGGKAAVMKELSEENNGKRPVTKDEKLLKIMADKIAEHCEKNRNLLLN